MGEEDGYDVFPDDSLRRHLEANFSQLEHASNRNSSSERHLELSEIWTEPISSRAEAIPTNPNQQHRLSLRRRCLANAVCRAPASRT